MDLHIFKGKPFRYPVLMGTYTDWEETQLQYLEHSIETDRESYTTRDLCKWAVAHRIKFQVLKPVSILQIIRHPVKGMKVYRMQQEMKRDGLL